MKQTKAKRKLLAKDVLDALANKIELGVPLSRAIRDLKLDISNPTAKKLLNCYSILNSFDRLEFEESETVVNNSMFPAWLDKSSTNVQENPDGWIYVGYFPLGEWQHDTNN